MKVSTEIDCYYEGKKAYMDKKSFNDNPYKRVSLDRAGNIINIDYGSGCSKAWIRGFEEMMFHE